MSCARSECQKCCFLIRICPQCGADQDIAVTFTLFRVVCILPCQASRSPTDESGFIEETTSRPIYADLSYRNDDGGACSRAFALHAADLGGGHAWATGIHLNSLSLQRIRQQDRGGIERRLRDRIGLVQLLGVHLQTIAGQERELACGA